MKRHPALIAALAAVPVCLALFAVVFWASGRGPRWKSDPARVRPASVRPSGAPQWQNYTTTTTDVPPVPPVDARQFDSFAVSTDETAVTVVCPNTFQPPYDVADCTVHRVGPEQRFAINDGGIELRYVGVAYGAMPASRSTPLPLPGLFFRARDLAPLTGATLDREIPNDRNRQVNFHGRFPAVQFSFTLERLDDFRFLGITAYDARTHLQVVFGGFSGGQRNPSERHFNVDLQLWHQTPIDVVVTVAHGPYEVVPLEAKVGETFRHTRGEMKLIAIADGKATGGGGRGSAGTNSSHVRLDRPPNQKWTTFVFASLTPARSLPLGFEFFDAAGHRIPSDDFMGLGGELRSASVETGTNETTRIQAKLYRHFKRLVFRLPELPGLPPENRQTENLFDVRIPFARVQADYDLLSLLENSLQMSVRHVIRPRSPSAQTSYFPHFYTNTTPAELLQEYRKLAAESLIVRVDTEKYDVVLKPHPLVELWGKIKKAAAGQK